MHGPRPPRTRALGPLAFFAPHSGYPPHAGIATAIILLVVVVDLWLCLIGGALLLVALVAMLGELPDRQFSGGQQSEPMPSEALHREPPPLESGDQPSVD